MSFRFLSRNRLSFVLLGFCAVTSVIAQDATPDTSYVEGRDYIIVNSTSSSGTQAASAVVQTSKDSYTSTFRIYDTIVAGFSLPEERSSNALSRIQSQYNWYAKNPEYMQRVWTRAQPYMHYVKTELQKRNMPMELALLPIVESAFDPFAYSHGRASGMWQFIPGTAKMYKVKQNWWYDGRRDVIDSTQAALNYLESLHRMFDGNWLHAIAAYNSGPGNVRKGIRRNKKKNKPTDFWSLRLPKETEAYVPKLIALKRLFNERKFYHQLPEISDQAHFAVVETGSQIDLAMAAKLSGTDLDTIYKLNPGFNRWATAPKGPHRLLVPKNNASQFQNALNTLPESERIQVSRYKIKNGDVLGKIAKQHGITISAIKELNDLNSNSIRAGKFLLIPKASTDISAYTKTQDARLSTIKNRKRSGTKQIHAVKNGESFWTIAKKYGVTTRQLAAWNGMAPKDTLRVGQNLVIWKKDSRSASANASPSTTRKIYYKVRKGDSLSRIASKFKVRTAQVKAWNQGKLAKYLQPGQTLVLHVDVLKQSGG